MGISQFKRNFSVYFLNTGKAALSYSRVLLLGIEDVGLYFTFYSFTLLFTRIAGGRLADRFSEKLVNIPGMIVMVLSFVILAYATSLTAFVISGVLFETPGTG